MFEVEKRQESKELQHPKSHRMYVYCMVYLPTCNVSKYISPVDSMGNDDHAVMSPIFIFSSFGLGKHQKVHLLFEQPRRKLTSSHQVTQIKTLNKWFKVFEHSKSYGVLVVFWTRFDRTLIFKYLKLSEGYSTPQKKLGINTP